MLGVFWGVCGGVLEAFLWYFGRFLGGKHKGTTIRNKCINTIIYFFIFVFF